MHEPVMKYSEGPGTVGDPALFFKGDLGKRLPSNIENGIVTKSCIPPRGRGDPSCNRPCEYMDSPPVSKRDGSDEPGAAIQLTLHQFQDTGIADRL